MHPARQRLDACRQLRRWRVDRLDARAEHAAEAAQLLVRAEALIVGGNQHQIGRILLEHVARRELGRASWSCPTPAARSAPARRCARIGGAHTWMRRASSA